MKNLIGVLCCIIVSKILSSVMVDNLMIMLLINYFALVIGYLGTLCFAVLTIYDMQI